MKLFTKVHIALVFAATSISWLNCSSHNPAEVDLNDPRTFPGKYILVSLTEKFGGGFGQLTYIAGERTTVTTRAGSKFVTVTGRLTLTETTYLISFTTKTETAFGERTDTTSSTGTYSISGSTFTLVSDANGETKNFSISMDGSRMTVESDQDKFVFEKQ